MPRQPPARVLPPQPKVKSQDDYLGDVDLPSSSESESEEEDGRHKKLYTPEEKEAQLHNMVRGTHALCMLAKCAPACAASLFTCCLMRTGLMRAPAAEGHFL